MKTASPALQKRRAALAAAAASKIEGASVKSLKFSGQGSPHYIVVISFPDGTEKRTSTAYAACEKKVCKRIGLRMTTNAGKAVAARLRAKIDAAIADREADPKAAGRMAKAMASAAEKKRKADEERIRQRNAQLRKQIVKDMMELNASSEDAVDMWKESVTRDVMES